ncbi:MAG: SMP-30/gluconolactonase/LRE family protein, partial [Mesorhizobium sp.]
DPDGTLIGKIRIPETVANLAFGGAKRNRLFITARQSLYSVFVVANAAARG